MGISVFNQQGFQGETEKVEDVLKLDVNWEYASQYA